MSLPPRTADTMSDAIALSSPSGRMSKRAKKAASRGLALDLFGPASTREDFTGSPPAPDPRQQLLDQAQRLRDLAARGMCVRKYTKEADRLEKEAAAMTAPTEKPDQC